MAKAGASNILTDEVAEVCRWYLDLKAETNDTFFPLLWDEHRYLVLKGGAGSGKSIFVGRKVLERVANEEGHRFLVVRKVARTIKESCFRQLVEQARESYPDRLAAVNLSDYSIKFQNGSEIITAGLDDVEKLKSIYGLTGVWIEEASELLESDFNQLDTRLRGETPYYKQIILSFNPVSATHWLKRRFFDAPDERATVHESTYKDNRFLDDEYRHTLEGFKNTDPYYYTVYCLGQWGVTGRTVFDGQSVTERLTLNIKPVRTGYFADDGEFVDAQDGWVKVYEEPTRFVPYVIGGDTAGEGSDFFVAQVIDNRTGRQVCTMRRQMDEDKYAEQLYHLGMWYNKALVGVETNFSTYPVRELERLGYPNQYTRESFDSYTHALKKQFGFRTDSRTRPAIIAELIKAARDDISIVTDRDTLEEMLTFVRNEKLRPEAEEGAHDDCIMALAIAYGIRDQQRYTLAPQSYSRDGWTPDMREDYKNASKEVKKYLLEKWGASQ